MGNKADKLESVSPLSMLTSLPENKVMLWNLFVRINDYIPEFEWGRSGRYGSFFIRIILSYSEGWRRAAIALEIRTAI